MYVKCMINVSLKQLQLEFQVGNSISDIIERAVSVGHKAVIAREVCDSILQNERNQYTGRDGGRKGVYARTCEHDSKTPNRIGFFLMTNRNLVEYNKKTSDVHTKKTMNAVAVKEAKLDYGKLLIDSEKEGIINTK